MYVGDLAQVTAAGLERGNVMNRVNADEETLSVVIGTYNRIDQLQVCIRSIFEQTKTRVRVYVTDAGSTDGTVEYLQSIASDALVPIFAGKRIGQAAAYNEIFQAVTTPYVCWLSDDHEVTENGLDVAVGILEVELGVAAAVVA